MDNNYRLTITLEGAGGNSGNNNANKKINAVGGERTATYEDKNANKVIQQIFGYKAVKSMVDTVASYNVSLVQLKTGSTEAQQRANFNYTVATQGYNIVEGAVAGFMVGNVAGAVAGALLSIMRTELSYSMKQNTLNIQNELEQTSQRAAATRATYSGSRYQRAIDE